MMNSVQSCKVKNHTSGGFFICNTPLLPLPTDENVPLPELTNEDLECLKIVEETVSIQIFCRILQTLKSQ